MIAALVGDHAEPPLDQREVLAVLAEQHRGEPVVVEGEHDLRRRRLRRTGPGRCRVRACATPSGSLRPRPPAGATVGALTSVPNRLLLPTSVIVTGVDFADQRRRRHDLHRLQIWRAADDLAGLAARLFEQHVEGHAVRSAR